MNILGIETSSIVCSVGLVNERGFSVERSLVDPHIHSEKLITLIVEVLRMAELTLESIDAVAVSIGPGSFTGLRIGLSTAKGLCYSLDRPLIAVPTFDSIFRIGWEDKPSTDRLSIALDAKQGEFYFATQERNERGTKARVTVRSLTPDDVRATETASTLAAWITDRTDVLLHGGVVSSRIFDYVVFCGGITVANIGLGKFRRGELTDVSSSEPMYLKEFLVKSATS